MAIINIKRPRIFPKGLIHTKSSPERAQLKVLVKLLKKARFTDFGQKFHFDEILLSDFPPAKFQELVPIFNYNKIYKEWWHRTLLGVPDVCWPGKVTYYALSSGTSEASSKFIPVTTDMLKANRSIMLKQLIGLRNYENIPIKSLSKGWLILGGSTDLEKYENGYYAGDLSGITAKKSPFWFQPFYKPGKKLSKEKDWNKKLEEIVELAPNWDIGFLVGVPAWIQMCLEMVIKRYNLANIHEIWPNLAFFVHGGVSFEPYKKGFESLLGKPITYVETYLASEGFIATQDKQNAKGMRLILNEHIFFEFVPFDDKNFTSDGDLVDKPETLLVQDVEEGKDYALLMSTSAGAWRYLIGDTVRFIDKQQCEIIITGRTKHFLSLVGEHLSVDNMNKAVHQVCERLNISIPEFTVAGKPHGNFFSHHWYVACDQPVDKELLANLIDESLKQLNDDYAVERKSALKALYLDVLSEQSFMDFMGRKGKMGGQHKFPRVMKGKILEDWNVFLAEKGIGTV